MIGLFVYAFPGDFLTLLLILPYFLLFRALRDRFLMAFQAGVEVRHSRKDLGFEEAMACITFQSLFQMLFMIKRDGLLSLGA